MILRWILDAFESPDVRYLSSAAVDFSFAPSGELLAISGGGYSGVVLDAVSRQTLWEPEILDIQDGGKVEILRSVIFAISPDGRTIAAGSSLGPYYEPGDRSAITRLWDTSSQTEMGAIDAPQRIDELAFSFDGAYIAVIGAGAGGEGSISVLDRKSGEWRTIATKLDNAAMEVVFSPDGSLIFVDRNQVTMWDPATGEERVKIPREGKISSSLALSPDGKTLALGRSVCGAAGTVELIELQTGKVIRRLETDLVRPGALTDCRDVTALVFTPDGKTLAMGTRQGFVLLWDVDEGRELVTLSGHQSPVRGLGFSHDGRTLVSGDEDGFVKYWDWLFELKMLYSQFSWRWLVGDMENIGANPSGGFQRSAESLASSSKSGGNPASMESRKWKW